MKKLLLATIALGLGVNLYAQGTVVFANNSSSLITTNLIAVGGTAGAAATTSSGGTVRVALYWGVLGATEGQLVQIGPSAGISPVAGRVNAGNYTTGAATAPGTAATFQVRAWTGNYATYEAAYAGLMGGDFQILLGGSPVFTATTGGAGSPPGAPVTLAGTMPGFSLAVIPEPSTYAIFGVGLLGLLFKLGRRKG
jgi:hypothetical protein